MANWGIFKMPTRCTGAKASRAQGAPAAVAFNALFNPAGRHFSARRGNARNASAPSASPVVTLSAIGFSNSGETCGLIERLLIA
jgi:hypothetical protein